MDLTTIAKEYVKTWCPQLNHSQSASQSLKPGLNHETNQIFKGLRAQVLILPGPKGSSWSVHLVVLPANGNPLWTGSQVFVPQLFCWLRTVSDDGSPRSASQIKPRMMARDGAAPGFNRKGVLKGTGFCSPNDWFPLVSFFWKPMKVSNLSWFDSALARLLLDASVVVVEWLAVITDEIASSTVSIFRSFRLIRLRFVFALPPSFFVFFF